MNLLEAIDVEFACLSCGQKYRVSLDAIAASYQAMREGCPVAVPALCECPRPAYANLVDEDAMGALERAWSRIEEQVASAGGRALTGAGAAPRDAAFVRTLLRPTASAPPPRSENRPTLESDVDEAVRESIPASDPPPWTPTHVGPPRRHAA